uniref:Uncharacterized protein n=1 Tax=Sphaeramia orbicularis TaxID=375764 RepID=A0A673CRS0_9TELE
MLLVDGGQPKIINGHISQIPGLSPVVSPSDERVKGRRVGVLDSDSEYVKLAKQGGHKGLLWHDESVTSKPISYKPPAWFCTASEDINNPSLINSEEKKTPRAFQRQEPPFGSDNMSAWERGGSSNGKEKNNNLPNSEMEKLQTSDHCRETGKFRRIVFDKKPAPVDMSKLLRFGYAEQDDKHTSTADVSST